jgi:hypothetical protein
LYQQNLKKKKELTSLEICVSSMEAFGMYYTITFQHWNKKLMK